MNRSDTREEHDSLGTVRVPADAPWGAQTGRALENFTLQGGPMPPEFIRALALIKGTAARVNCDFGLLDRAIADAIEAAAGEIASGRHPDAFPVDRFQTGSGTSTNMNMNEVIARIGGQAAAVAIHPNDHVNLGQSSNDTIPTAIHVSASMAVTGQLLPALEHLGKVLREQGERFDPVVKTGRTHLMDAVPMTLGQEFSCWATQVENARERISTAAGEMRYIAQGGTAIGSGVNTHPDFAAAFARRLGIQTGLDFQPAPDLFERIACQDTALGLSAQFRGLAVVLMKICSDLRWMNSGPHAGLSEISLRALQPGSSIMPGKVNPVIPEAVTMAAAQVIGYDAATSVAAQGGNFQLNTMLPLVACNLLECCRLLTESAHALVEGALRDLRVNVDHLAEVAARNPMLVTALSPRIGYEAAARIAQLAAERHLPVLEVARAETDLAEAELAEILDPVKMTRGGAG